MEKKYSFGFTLVELMIVIAVIAILAALVIAFFTTQLFKGTDAKRKADIDRIKIAAEEYEKDHNCYPEYITCGIHKDQPIYPYLNDVPCDPKTNASYQYEHDGESCPSWFRVYAVLENTRDLSSTPLIGPSYAFNYVRSSENAPDVVVGSATASPTPAASSAEQPLSGFYGCINGSCVSIAWDGTRPGPVCDPNYQSSNCYGQCGSVSNECISWE
jgi:prepilin-type N-terminal cleavage/methylation domain-containing protein